MNLPKALFQKSLQNSYHFAKFYHQQKMLLANLSSDKQPIVVHQMGKVASTAIYESLNALNLKPYAIYQTHYLSDLGLKESECFYKENYQRIRAIHTPLAHSFYIRRKLKSSKSKLKKIKVITLVRDPVAKNLSSFFQNLEYLFGFSLSKKLQSLTLESILEDLESLFIEEFDRHHVPLEWFDLELKKVFEIDVFETPFALEKGYQIYAGNKADVLLIKLENIGDIAADAFDDFLNLKKFELKFENVGDDKNYAQIYKLFKSSISLPDNYLDKMYASKYVKHFYSSHEIDALRRKWKK